VKSKVTKGLPIVTIRPNSVTPAVRGPPAVEQLTVGVSEPTS
jgi:electron transfer flavoprotein alpha subunit